MKKLLILILALATLLTAVACTGGKDNSGEKSTQNTEEDYPLPVVDYKGKEFRVSLMRQESGKEFFIEGAETSDSPTEFALYQRNSMVEDRYSIKIKPDITNAEGYFGHTTAIVNTILDEDDRFDLVTSYAMAAGPLIMNTALVDLKGQNNIDLDASYWVQDINDKFEIEDHLYTAVGDTSVYSILFTYAMMFNVTKGDAEGITDEVFEKIDNKEWTIDYFSDLVTRFYDNIDQENGRSSGDFYGFQGELLTNLDNYSFAFDIPMVNNSGDGGELLEFVYGGEKLAVAVDKIIDLYWNNRGSYVEGDHIYAFTHGNAMFASILLNDCFTYLKEMDDVYAILPYPMYNEEQDGYRTGMMDNYHVMGIPTTVEDLDFASLITEALNYEGEKYLYPAYFEDALQGKHVRHERTSEMLQILLDGRTADFGTLLQNNLNNVSIWFRWMVRDKNRDTTSWVDANSDVHDKLEAIIDKYREAA